MPVPTVDQQQVPFADLKVQYEALKAEIDAAIQGVLDDTAFIGGARVRAFEQAFAAACGAQHAVGLGNGTDALYVALRMLGIGPGDEVLVPAMTWIATAETVTQAGATPVFVDIDPRYYTMDAAHAAARVTPRTKALIPVHLYGQAAAMDALQDLAAAHGLAMIEDCAQAHLTRHRGRCVGTIGDVGTFSFYPGKNLGAYGDAGAVVTDDADLARRMRMFANHGQLVKHQHQMEGINSRLDTLQAAVLSVKLPHLPAWVAQRRANAAVYDALLADVPQVTVPQVRPETEHTYHLYVVQAERRDALQAFLGERGVATAIQYPTALPNTPAYAYLRTPEQTFPVATRCQDTILSLPMYPELGEDAIAYVAEQIRAFYAGA